MSSQVIAKEVANQASPLPALPATVVTRDTTISYPVHGSATDEIIEVNLLNFAGRNLMNEGYKKFDVLVEISNLTNIATQTVSWAIGHDVGGAFATGAGYGGHHIVDFNTSVGTDVGTGGAPSTRTSPVTCASSYQTVSIKASFETSNFVQNGTVMHYQAFLDTPGAVMGSYWNLDKFNENNRFRVYINYNGSPGAGYTSASVRVSVYAQKS